MTTNTTGDAGLVEPTYLADICKRALEWSRTADKASAGFIVRDLTNSIEALTAEVERLRRANALLLEQCAELHIALTNSITERDAAESRLSSIEGETIEWCAKIADSWSRHQQMLLHCGEMTRQELRTAVAVANGIATAIRNREG